MKKLMVFLLVFVLLISGAGCKQETAEPENGGTEEISVHINAGPDHTHQPAEQPQTADDPVSGYCGNTWTTLYIGEKQYSFMYGNSVTLTDILINLNYDPDKVCRCRPAYTVDTEFGSGYGIDLTQGYARCEKGQADLTREQINAIAEIIEWAETTECEYPLPNRTAEEA